MSVCTPTAMAREAHPERAISSQSTAVVRKSAPPPPYFSSYSTPRKPSSPMRGQMDLGICPACSHSSIYGSTSRWTKLRTACLNIWCCSLKIFTQPPHPALSPCGGEGGLLVPFALVVDLFGILRDGPRGDDLDLAPQLHHVAQSRGERGRCGACLLARRQLHAQREHIVVAIARHHGLRARGAAALGHGLVHLARVDEHAPHLGHLVDAPSPAEHARRRPSAGTWARVHHREVAGAEAQPRVALVAHRGHDLAQLAVA